MQSPIHFKKCLAEIFNITLYHFMFSGDTKLERKRGREKSVVSDYVHITVTIPFSLLSVFDKERKLRGYTRSEAIRKAIRSLLEIWTGRRL